MNAFGKYMTNMFSSSNEVSWGRITATLMICYVTVMQIILIYLSYQADPKKIGWVAIDPFWRDLILGTFGISKGGETVQTFATSKKSTAKMMDEEPKMIDGEP
jgi:hypothetical protein